MSGLFRGVAGRAVGVALAAVLVVAVVVFVGDDGRTRTLTAHFPRAVSVYEGTDVRVLGVNVGRVTEVVPEGNSVRVEIEYDAEHRLPAEAEAAIITPTLVADRFVQITPAYTKGEVLADGADIPLEDTGVPVELDRIYAALRDLTSALGPEGVNADGTLDRTLRAGAQALRGNGARGNQMLQDLARAATTFGEGSGDLFETVTQLATFTEVLAENDAVVRAFMADLAGVSRSLVTERAELQRALASVAGAVGTVRTFVRDNRAALVTDVEKLTRVVKAVSAERESLDTALTVAPVAIGNLVLGFNVQTGSIGSRMLLQANAADIDGLLCMFVQYQENVPQALKDTTCKALETILEQAQRSGRQPTTRQAATPPARTTPERTPALDPSDVGGYVSGGDATLEGLLGGAGGGGAS